MPLDADICYRALRSRDARFDGRFFAAVRTTGVYCRPICPAPKPKRRNVEFYSCAAAAAEAGYRPCFRCRPEASPGTPAWLGTSSTVSRALRLISEGYLDGASVDDLAARLGIGARHLRRLFLEHLGATPVAVAQTRRIHSAKTLLDGTTLSITDIAFSAGFASVRRFNDAFRQTYGMTPSEVRAAARQRRKNGDIELRLAYRPPFDWESLLDFLRPRGIPGVEVVTKDTYRRGVAIGDVAGIVRVSHLPQSRQLSLRIPLDLGEHASAIVERVRCLFDLGADPAEIAQHLEGDAMLAPVVRKYPGLRVPGAWDPFETAVRAVLGQQVSVKGATTLAGRIAERYGTAFDSDDPDIHRIFPAPARLVRARANGVGMPAMRMRAIRELAKASLADEKFFDGALELDAVTERLLALDGFGPWTAHYVAMRVFRQPDGFPSGDLALRRAAEAIDPTLKTESKLKARAEAWRPWRAYATMWLWKTYTG